MRRFGKTRVDPLNKAKNRILSKGISYADRRFGKNRTNPLEKEKMLANTVGIRDIKPTDGQATHAVDHYVNDWLANTNDKRIIAAIRRTQMKRGMRKLKQKVNSEFEGRFHAFLTGRMADIPTQPGRPYTKTPIWGNRWTSLMHDPEVKQYINDLADQRFEFDRYIKIMEKMGPVSWNGKDEWGPPTMLEYYLYFKYVLEEHAELDTDEYLTDWRIWKQQRHRRQGFYQFDNDGNMIRPNRAPYSTTTHKWGPGERDHTWATQGAPWRQVGVPDTDGPPDAHDDEPYIKPDPDEPDFGIGFRGPNSGGGAPGPPPNSNDEDEDVDFDDLIRRIAEVQGLENNNGGAGNEDNEPVNDEELFRRVQALSDEPGPFAAQPPPPTVPGVVINPHARMQNQPSQEVMQMEKEPEEQSDEEVTMMDEDERSSPSPKRALQAPTSNATGSGSKTVAETDTDVKAEVAKIEARIAGQPKQETDTEVSNATLTNSSASNATLTDDPTTVQTMSMDDLTDDTSDDGAGTGIQKMSTTPAPTPRVAPPAPKPKPKPKPVRPVARQPETAEMVAQRELREHTLKNTLVNEKPKRYTPLTHGPNEPDEAELEALEAVNFTWEANDHLTKLIDAKLVMPGTTLEHFQTGVVESIITKAGMTQPLWQQFEDVAREAVFTMVAQGIENEDILLNETLKIFAASKLMDYMEQKSPDFAWLVDAVYLHERLRSKVAPILKEALKRKNDEGDPISDTLGLEWSQEGLNSEIHRDNVKDMLGFPEISAAAKAELKKLEPVLDAFNEYVRFRDSLRSAEKAKYSWGQWLDTNPSARGEIESFIELMKTEYPDAADKFDTVDGYDLSVMLARYIADLIDEPYLEQIINRFMPPLGYDEHTNEIIVNTPRPLSLDETNDVMALAVDGLFKEKANYADKNGWDRRVLANVVYFMLPLEYREGREDKQGEKKFPRYAPISFDAYVQKKAPDTTKKLKPVTHDNLQKEKAPYQTADVEPTLFQKVLQAVGVQEPLPKPQHTLANLKKQVPKTAKGGKEGDAVVYKTPIRKNNEVAMKGKTRKGMVNEEPQPQNVLEARKRLLAKNVLHGASAPPLPPPVKAAPPKQRQAGMPSGVMQMPVVQATQASNAQILEDAKAKTNARREAAVDPDIALIKQAEKVGVKPNIIQRFKVDRSNRDELMEEVKAKNATRIQAVWRGAAARAQQAEELDRQQQAKELFNTSISPRLHTAWANDKDHRKKLKEAEQYLKDKQPLTEQVWVAKYPVELADLLPQLKMHRSSSFTALDENVKRGQIKLGVPSSLEDEFEEYLKTGNLKREKELLDVILYSADDLIKVSTDSNNVRVKGEILSGTVITGALATAKNTSVIKSKRAAVQRYLRRMAKVVVKLSDKAYPSNSAGKLEMRRKSKTTPIYAAKAHADEVNELKTKYGIDIVMEWEKAFHEATGAADVKMPPTVKNAVRKAGQAPPPPKFSAGGSTSKVKPPVKAPPPPPQGTAVWTPSEQDKKDAAAKKQARETKKAVKKVMFDAKETVKELTFDIKEAGNQAWDDVANFVTGKGKGKRKNSK